MIFNRFGPVLRGVIAAAALNLGLLPGAASAQSYPTNPGLYLRVGNVFSILEPVATHFGYLRPAERPETYPLPTGNWSTSFNGVYLTSSSAVLLQGGISEFDYLLNVMPLPRRHAGRSDVALVAVGVPPSFLGDRIEMVADVWDYIETMPPVSPEQAEECRRLAARGMAPLAGGFDPCRAGDAGFQGSDGSIRYFNALWGRSFDNAFATRRINGTTLEYSFEVDLCRGDRVRDLRDILSLHAYGWAIFTPGNQAFILACENQLPGPDILGHAEAAVLEARLEDFRDILR